MIHVTEVDDAPYGLDYVCPACGKVGHLQATMTAVYSFVPLIPDQWDITEGYLSDTGLVSVHCTECGASWDGDELVFEA